MTNLNFGGHNEDALTEYARGVGYRLNVAQSARRPRICHMQHKCSIPSIVGDPSAVADLQVITLDSQGYRANTVYYSYDQLLTLPMVTVKTDRDPNTNTPATYTGIYISDLFEAFGAVASLDVIGANRLDTYKQYYDRDYVAKHRPILLLKFDDKVPDDWPQTEDRNMLGPYCVVHESFGPAQTIYGYVEQPRSMDRV